MKYIEVSKKIRLEQSISAQNLKTHLVQYLERTIDIDKTTEGLESFKVEGTTGSPAALTRHARLDLDIHIDFDEKGKTARIIISGYAYAARSLVVFYSLAFFLILLVGLLPGFYETSQDRSGAMDAMFFLVFGIFTIYDVNSKLAVTREQLEAVLESLNTTFG